MTDPLSDIENEKAQRDMGAFIYRIYRGALEDGASRFEAFVAAVAWVTGISKANDIPPPKEEEE